MIDLKYFKGFAVVGKDISKEAQYLHIFCLMNDISLLRLGFKEKCPADYVPCGSVEWCQIALGKRVVPDYYPKWCSDYLHRKVWYTDKFPYKEECFIKPATRYKRFTGFIKPSNSWKGKKKGEQYWCSEPTVFINEWRYYISNGKVIAGEWYWGDEENTPNAPDLTKLGIHIPKSYYGALDFGWDTKDNFSLIESQHPFACGWYGSQEDSYKYFQWLVDGWKYMQKMSW